jgi:hypothetical protein
VFAQNDPTIHEWNAEYTGQNLNHPTGLYKRPASQGGLAAGWLFIADSGNNKIKVFEPGVGIVTVAGTGAIGNQDGTTTTATFNSPAGLDGPGYIARGDSPHMSYSDAIELTVYDTGNSSIRALCLPMKVDPFAPICTNTVTTSASSAGSVNSPGLGVGTTTNTQTKYFANSASHTISSLNTSNQLVVFAGSGTPGYRNGASNQALFAGPTKMVVGPRSTYYVSDAGNFVIRAVTGSSVSTFAGSGQRGYVDGSASQAKFSLPTSVAYNAADGYVYVVDSFNNCIRRINSSGTVSTYAGTTTPGNVDGSLTQARFSLPTDLIIDGSVMYISDTSNNSIREINMSTGQVSTLAR